MIKLVYLLWTPEGMTPEERRLRLVEGAAPLLLDSPGVRGLSMHIDDDRARVKAPVPPPRRSEPVRGAVSVWLDDMEQRWPIEDELRSRGFELAGYEVEGSVYTEYGGSPHAAPRSWGPGERSPGIVTLNLLRRPKRLEPEEWKRRWFERMSPVSEAIQPRARYVRNVVTSLVTEGAPAWDGVVMEAWPTPEHLTRKRLFYGADNPWQLARNMGRIMGAVTSFLQVWKIQVYTVSEYLWHQPDQVDSE